MTSYPARFRTITISAVRRFSDPLRRDSRLVVLVVCYLFFVVGWSAIALWRFYSFNSGIFDLGVAMERGWLIYHTNWTVSTFLAQFFHSGILFVTFPLTIPANYPLLLVFQAAEVGATVFPLYGIARQSRLDRNVALVVAGSFLAYFPITGELWFDFHYQTLFMALFLAGYFFFRKGRLWTALALMALSGTVRFPYAVFPLLFALWTISEVLLPRVFGRTTAGARPLRFGGGLLIVSAILLTGGFLSGSAAAGLSSSLNLTGNVPIGSELNVKLLTVLFFLGPVLLVPVFSPKWLTFLIPAGYVLFLSGSLSTTAPAILHAATPAGIAPFVFLGFIEGLPRAARFAEWLVAPRPTSYRRRQWRPVDSLEVASVSAAVILLSASVMTPYGPFNQYTGKYNYELYNLPGPNFTRYNEVENVVHFIPASTPYIIGQELLPGLFPRPLAQATYPVVNPVLDTFPSNITEARIVNNTIPINVYGTIETTRADYVVGDPYLWTLTIGNPSIMRFMQMMYGSGHFGIVAEESGVTLIQRDYAGPVRAFVPWYDILLGTNASGNPVAGSSGSPAPGFLSTSAWVSQYDLFVPGTYRIAVKIWGGASNCSSVADVALVDAVGGNTTNLTTVRSCNLEPDQWNWVDVPIVISRMWESLQVKTNFANWPGGQMAEALFIETSPPSNLGVI